MRLPVSCGMSAAAVAGDPTDIDTLLGIPVSCGGSMVAVERPGVDIMPLLWALPLLEAIELVGCCCTVGV